MKSFSGRTRATCLIVALSLSPCASYAQTVSDPAYANMQRVMGATIQNVAVSRGLSTTDPRTYSTLYRVGVAATTAVAGAGTALLVGGTAPAWGTVLGLAALGGVVSYAVNVGIDGAVKWLFGTPANTPITITAFGATAQQYIDINTTGVLSMSTIVGNSIGQPYTTIETDLPYYRTRTWFSTTAFTNPQGGTYTLSQNYTYNGTYYYVWVTATSSSTNPCPANYTQNGQQCVSNGAVGPAITTSLQTLTQAINALTESNKNTDVDPATLALMMNYLWQKAAQTPGYDGLPYDVTRPVTADDVKKVRDANPTAYPKTGGLVAPVPSGSGGFQPSTAPTGAVVPAATVTPPNATNPGAATAPINIGADPGIGLPTLEETPTAQSILDPLLNMIPGVRTFVVPAHSSVCPKGNFTVWNTAMSIDGQCTLAESIRPSLSAAMLLVWALSALIVVLRA